MAEGTKGAAIGQHGANRLPSVEVDTYNIEIKDENGFLGDRASRGAFIDILEGIRVVHRVNGEDALGDEHSEESSKRDFEAALLGDDIEAAAMVQGAIEAFAEQLAYVTGRFLKSKGWADTERIVVGGGFREGRTGELAIARARAMLKAKEIAIEMVPIRNHPDEAGLIGCLHLAPSWIFEGYDSILAVDIGGSNIRCGVVKPNWQKATDLSKAAVWRFDLWRHVDDDPTRESAVERLVKMLGKLIKAADEEGLKLAPFIGISCPGAIQPDGSIAKGAQNLPGNWESSRFNLPAIIVEAIPTISGHDTLVLMHNDGVVQGLSEAPFMQDVSRWGVLTIGTGLGNARFTNRAKPIKPAKPDASSSSKAKANDKDNDNKSKDKDKDKDKKPGDKTKDKEKDKAKPKASARLKSGSKA